MITPKDIPELKFTRKKVTLPNGNPMGKDNIIILMTNNRNESFNIINDKTNYIATNNYKYYYYPLRYRGKLYHKVYNINLLNKKREFKNEIENKTSIHPYPYQDINMNDMNRNTFFDFSKYFEIYKTFTKKLLPRVKMETFWDYFKGILNTPGIKKYNEKMVLIDINNFRNIIKGRVIELIDNPVYMLYYTLLKRPELIKDINLDFYIFNKLHTVRVNPSKCDDKSYTTLMTELKRLYRTANISIEKELDEETINKDELHDTIVSNIKQRVTGDKDTDINEDPNEVTDLEEYNKEEEETEDDDKEVANIIKDKIKDVEEKIMSSDVAKNSSDDEIEEVIANEVEMATEEDNKAIEKLYKSSFGKKTVAKSTASTARDELLRKNQEKIMLGNMTLKALHELNTNKVEIPSTDISNHIKSTNKNMAKSKFVNHNKTYIEKVMPKDISEAITSLSDKSLPIFIRNIKVEDTSDELNYVDTYTVELEDGNRQRTTMKFDIPKFIDNKFMYLGGNKKLIMNQEFLLPLVKTGEDTVQIVTNYNKMFVRRVDIKTLSSIAILKKILAKNSDFAKRFEMGNAMVTNNNRITTIEYDELSKIFWAYKSPKLQIFFSQEDIYKQIALKKIKVPEGKLLIGFSEGKPVYIDLETQTTDDDLGIVDLIFNSTNDEALIKEYKTVKPGKRLMYGKIKTMGKDLPAIMLCSAWEGLSTVLKKMNLEYRISDKKPNDLKINENYIRFSDCYMIYQDKPEYGLMINGLRVIETEKYTFADMDSSEPYLRLFLQVYGKMSIANALDNTYEFTIDPITKEILTDMNLPTDIVSLIIYAVKLLADNQYTFEMNQNLARIRSIETIPAILYDTIAKNYITYKNSNGRKKFNIPRDSVITKLLSSPNVEDYSTLNPVQELERCRTTSYKGWRGINLDDAYSVPKRCYDKTMTGILSPISSPDASVGVSRVLTLEPNITSVRGYMKVTDDKDLDSLKDANLFSPGELTMPTAATYDDPIRIGHAIKQSKHVIPVENSSPVLISNGVEEACRYHLSTDFVVNAKDNGKVLEIDENKKIMVVEYKNGEHQAINLAPVIVKNGGGGFYESNILTTDLKVGQKFTVNQPLAWNKDFFTKSDINGCRLNLGTLTKVALMSTYNTLEDSTFITHKLAREASTEMTFQKAANIGKNSNILKMVEVGDHIQIGDSLLEFDTSFEDASLNAFLDTLSKDPTIKDAIDAGSKNIIKSKYSGVIEDIKVYSTVELEEMSPSLRKIIKKYYDKVSDKKKLLDKYDKSDSIYKCGMLITDPTGAIKPSKYGVIKGNKVDDSVLVEFYIKHSEPLEVGSKIANFSALKNTIGEIVPEGYEPYGEFRPDEEISTIIASNSILKRMVPSIIVMCLGNKCIVELKRSLEKIYKSAPFSPAVRKNMEDLIYKFFTAFDKSGTNTKKYKGIFDGMEDTEFNKFFKEFFNNDKEYLILDIVDYEHTMKIEDIERAANVLKIPLFETVYLPHMTMDKDMVIGTQNPVPVGYIHIKRTQQTVMKKNGMSINSTSVSELTGQVTGGDKNGRETDLENILMVSVGLEDTLKELNGPRADDRVAKYEMMQQIATNGYVRYQDLTYDVKNKTTLNTVDTYLIGMGLRSDLVNSGLMLNYNVEEEIRQTNFREDDY